MCEICSNFNPLAKECHYGGEAQVFRETTDAASSVSTIYTIEAGDSFDGNMGVSDSDWVRIELTAGDSYRFDLTGDSFGLRDPLLALRDSNGVIVAFDDDGGPGLDSSLSFTAVASGDYYLDATSYSFAAGGFSTDTGGYMLETEVTATGDGDTGSGDDNFGFDETSDAAADATTAFSVDVNGTFTGVHGAGDTDWVSVELVEGQSYTIDVSGFGADGMNDTTLTVVDANGLQIGFNDDGGPGLFSSLTFTAGETGTFFIQVQAYSQSTDVGAYQIEVTDNGVGDPDDDGAFTNDQIASFLNSGYWGGNQRAFDVAPGGELNVDLSGLTAEGRNLAELALDAWEQVIGISFDTAPGSGEAIHITFDDNQSGAFATSDVQNGVIQSSHVNVSTSWLASSGTTVDSYSFQTYIHEIGHAIGLGHAGNYNGSATYGVSNHYSNDSWQATVMSYFSQTENSSVTGSYAYVITPQTADILAAQELYGVAGDLRTSDTTYGDGSETGSYYDRWMSEETNVSFTILDDGGVDTLNFTSTGAHQRIDINEEANSSVNGQTGNMNISRGTVIENVNAGDGNDVITGNAADNRLNGGQGDNTLSGGDGDDILRCRDGDDSVDGGQGDDTVKTADGADVITLGAGDDIVLSGRGADQVDGGDGNDTIKTSYGDDTVDGGDGADIIVAFRGDEVLRGGDGDDTILGNLGDDTLEGGAGDDRMHGGPGRDVFVFNDDDFGSDRIVSFRVGSDKLDFSGAAEITSLDDLTLRQIGGSTVIDVNDTDARIVLGSVSNLIGNEDSVFIF